MVLVILPAGHLKTVLDATTDRAQFFGRFRFRFRGALLSRTFLQSAGPRIGNNLH